MNFYQKGPAKEWLELFGVQNSEDKCKVVYKKAEEENCAKFLELYNSNKEYDSDCIIASLCSTYNGTEVIPKDTTFCNVNGTSNDPNPYSNAWIIIIQWQ